MGFLKKRRDKPIRVIVADDQAEVRDALRHFLNKDGRFEVVAEADDGAEAVRMIGSERPDVVIVDLAMPRMNGFHAIREIVALSPETKIIVLSAVVPLVGTREDALALGAHEVFDKHTPPKKLIGAIIDLVGR